MGTPDIAQGLLEEWITRYRSDFQPCASRTFEASVLVNAPEDLTVNTGSARFNILVASSFLNGYKTLHGGAQAALASVAAEAAISTLDRLPALASISTDYLSSLKEGESGMVQAHIESGPPVHISC